MSVFHAGERRLQKRAGVAERMATVGDKVIFSELPLQHQQFYPLLPLVFVAAPDLNGQLWASVLCGAHGFVQALDAKQLRIHALPNLTDPLYEQLRPHTPLGVLGLEFPTRRRNRANGYIAGVDNAGFTVMVEQCFGNCPKYIQTRTPTLLAKPTGSALSITPNLNQQQCQWITQADTFFIASAWRNAVDISHRGGNAGFVTVEDSRTLYVPDFAGNNYFNTFGNLVQNPNAALLFIDFERGDLLQLAVTADVLWQGEQRGIRLHIHEVRHRVQALPIVFTSTDTPHHTPSK